METSTSEFEVLKFLSVWCKKVPVIWEIWALSAGSLECEPARRSMGLFSAQCLQEEGSKARSALQSLLPWWPAARLALGGSLELCCVSRSRRRLQRGLNESESKKPSSGDPEHAVTRIRTEVAAATTQSTNHYTITARHRTSGKPAALAGSLEANAIPF